MTDSVHAAQAADRQSGQSEPVTSVGVSKPQYFPTPEGLKVGDEVVFVPHCCTAPITVKLTKRPYEAFGRWYLPGYRFVKSRQAYSKSALVHCAHENATFLNVTGVWKTDAPKSNQGEV